MEELQFCKLLCAVFAALSFCLCVACDILETAASSQYGLPSGGNCLTAKVAWQPCDDRGYLACSWLQ
jgi:hypothetical protein